MIFRPGDVHDLPFLKKMLFEAFFWDPKESRPKLEDFQSNTEFRKLLNNWGRTGDTAFIAEAEKTKIGAAWFRLWTAENHSYGFVDDKTPEIAIAVSQAWRSKGCGRKLLQKIIAKAKEDGFPALSLSVDPANKARRLYESEGFVKVGESGTSWTLLLRF